MAAEKNIRIGLKGYMPSAVAEAETAAMDNAVDVWRLNTASRLQTEPHTPLNDVQTVAD